MGEQFIKFKKKAFTICLIKSALLGLAAGTLVAGVFLLLFKLEVLTGAPILALPIGLGSFLLAGGVGYLLLHLSDKQLAKYLDAEFKLEEKVQTALAYQKETDAIYQLQRNDANDALAAIPTERLSFKRLWAYILAVCIGFGSLVAGLVVSKQEEITPPKPEEAFAITDIQVAAMEELILYVENSKMQSPYRENVAQTLKGLLAELKLVETVSQKDETLAKAMDDVYRQTDESSAAVELMNALWLCESNSAKSLAETLNYYDWPKTDEWTYFSGELTGFRTTFIHADTVTENPDQEKMTAETGELLLRMQSNVGISLTRANVPSEDGLAVQLKRFAETNETYENGTHLYGFKTLSEQAETLGYEKIQKELDATFSAVGAGLFNAMEQHAANTGTGEYAMTRLDELFDCGLPKFERPDFYVSSSGEELPDGSEGGGGGLGVGGETVYGSDDLVLDPITNTYVEYGTILDKYYALMFGKVEEGNYTQQEKEAMEKYFAILYGGFDEEGE